MRKPTIRKYVGKHTGRREKHLRKALGCCLLASSCAIALIGQAGPEAAFHAAVAAYDAQQYADAAALLERLVPKTPNNFQVHELLGLTYGAESQNSKAVEQLQIAAKLAPASAPARTNLGTALVRAGKPAEAQTVLRDAVRIDPKNYDANHNLAELYLAAGSLREAIPFLETAHSIRPGDDANSYNLALSYLLAGDLPEARRLTEALLQQKPTSEMHLLLGRIEEHEGEFLPAADEFATAAHLDPSEENLFAWASEMLLHRTYDPAIRIFRDGTARYPKSPRLWVGLGMALYSRGEYGEAVQSLLTAADLDPQDARCYLFLSKAYLSSPDQAQTVIDHFHRYAELKPADARAQFYYAMSLWKGRRGESADVDYSAVEALLQKSIQLDGSFADAHLQLGILYNDERAYDKSLPEYQRALQLEPRLADAHFRLGRYYLRAGEKDKAQAELDSFKKLQAEHQAEVDRERAEVQQFVLSTGNAPTAQP